MNFRKLDAALKVIQKGGDDEMARKTTCDSLKGQLELQVAELKFKKLQQEQKRDVNSRAMEGYLYSFHPDLENWEVTWEENEDVVAAIAKIDKQIAVREKMLTELF